jgi:ribosomal-protein-alanine N-acetyltransferase
MTARVRPATDDDLERIVQISARCFSHPWQREAFASDVERSWTRVHVTEATDVPGAPVVGFVHYWLVAGEVQVMNVATDPSYRRRGHARALVAAMMDEARRTNSESVLLEVRATNVSAIALYASFGFAQTGLRERYYDDGEDAVLMAVRL